MKKGISILLLICALGISMAIGIFIGRTNREEYHPMPHKVSIESQQVPAHSEAFLIDINTAEANLLMDLPGIGQELADRIIAYRTENGPFATIEDLTKVQGIGDKRIEQLRPLITVGG
jgi:competence protein ComEA